MKYGVFVVLVVAIISVPVVGSTEAPLLTLDQALERVEYYPSVVSGEESREATQDSLDALLDKQAWSAILNGGNANQSGLVQYQMDDVRDVDGRLTVEPRLSISRNDLMGRQYSANFHGSANYGQDLSWGAGWDVSFTQTIWPSPRLSSDQRALLSHQQNLRLQQSQAAEERQQALRDIEDQYRLAQFAQERVIYAALHLENERHAFALTKEKQGMGEASRLDLIAAELDVFVAEGELEQAKQEGKDSLAGLLDGLDLEGEYQLESLEAEAFALKDSGKAKQQLAAAVVDNHPQLAQLQLDIDRLELELAAAQEGLKPDVSLRVRLNDDLASDASLSFSFPLADGHQRRNNVADKQEALDEAIETYNDEYQRLDRLIDKRLVELANIERKLHIAQLDLQRAKIELEIAVQQSEAGLLEQRSLNRYEVGLAQQELNFWQRSHEHNLFVRELESGMILSMVGGQ